MILNWPVIMEWTGAILLLIGIFFTLVAAIGLVRLPDLYSRMHAATKPQVLGLIFVCAGLVLEVRDWRSLILVVIVVVLQVVTAPVGSHLVARAAYRTNREDDANVVVDELTEDSSTSSFGDGSS